MPSAIDAPCESTMWISRSGSMPAAISALLIVPDSLSETWIDDDRVGAVREGRVVDRLELAGARRGGLRERRVRAPSSASQNSLGREVDAGPERLGAEGHRQRDDPDAARPSATAGSRSDAESVTNATLATGFLLRPPRPTDDTGRVTGADGRAPRDRSRYAFRDGPIAVGRDGRHLHAALLDRPHRGDARRLPGEAARARRSRVSPRRPSALLHATFYISELVAVAVLRRPVGPARPPPGDAVRPGLRGGRGDPHRADDEPARSSAATRLLEGASTAASIPSILGYIALATAGERGPPRQGGGPVRGRDAGRARRRLRRWRRSSSRRFGPAAFFLNAVVYGVSFLIYRFGVEDRDGEERAATAATRAPRGWT